MEPKISVNQSNTAHHGSYGTSLALVAILFFIFGFITWLNGTLIPFLKSACELNNFQAYLVTFAFYISYFVMAIPSSVILKKTGFKKGMSLGLFMMAVGTLIFLPAAWQRNYMYFLVGLFTQGLGLAILQTATNPYVTILGPEESAAKRISIMGIANKFAGIISPIILGAVLLRNIDPINEQLQATTDPVLRESILSELSQRIISPYIILTISLTILAVLVLISPLPELEDEEENPDIIKDHSKSSILSHPYLFLGAFAIFLYVGAEVIAADTIVNYGKFFNIPMDEAQFFTSVTLICMVTGYFVGIALIPKVMSQETALKICGLSGIMFTAALLFTKGYASVACLALLGLSHSLMWPAIWPMSLKGLGAHTKTGGALLIMGIAGGAVIPPLYGKIADISDPQSAYVILLPCYLFILYFSQWGHKVGYKKSNKLTTEH